MIEPAAAIEAMLFVAEEPIPAEELAEVLELSHEDVERMLGEYGKALEHRAAGIVLRNVGGGWRLYSHPDALPYLERFASTATANRLSAAAVETLAVVAYQQPVARNQVSEIRGVDSDSVLRTLERRGLISEVGRAPGSGSATLYGTTPLFLERMGLTRLEELPPLADHVPAADAVESFEETIRAED